MGSTSAIVSGNVVSFVYSIVNVSPADAGYYVARVVPSDESFGSSYCIVESSSIAVVLESCPPLISNTFAEEACQCGSILLSATIEYVDNSLVAFGGMPLKSE